MHVGYCVSQATLLSVRCICSLSRIVIFQLRLIRPHGLHAVHRCGLLLQMTHVACCVCLSVCVLGTLECCTKRLNHRDAVWGLTYVGSRDHY